MLFQAGRCSLGCSVLQCVAVCCSVLQCVADMEAGPSVVGFSVVGFSVVGFVLGDLHIDKPQCDNP